jgi:DNA polymerase-3 subunit gamma/tau
VAAIAAAWAAGERAAGLAQINAALDAGADPRQLGRQLVDYLRDVLLVGQGLAEQVERGAETKAEMAALAETISSERLAVAIRIFSRATLEAGWNWQPGLPLELALVEASAGPGSPATPPAAPIADEQAGQPMDGQPDAGSERIQAQPDEHNKRITPAEEKPARIMHETGALTLANMQTRWREVLAALFRHDPRTQALVNSCKPLSVRGDRLVLGFSSEILRKKMEQGHNLELVRTALAEVFDQPLEVRCVIASGWSMDDEQATPPPMEDDGMVATALRDLGAQVVDVETIAADEDQEEQDT